MSHFATLSPGHYVYETRMINSFSLSYFPPAPRLAQPSPILYLPARGTRPLKSPAEGSLFLPCVSINLLRGRRMLGETKHPPTPLQTNAKSHTTCWNPRNESYNSCILICLCLTLAVEKHHLKTQWETCVGTCDTAGGLAGGKEKTLHHNTCFILCAVRRTSLLPGSETWPHIEICSLSLDLHNAFLIKKERERSDL